LIIGGDHAITAPSVRAYCGAHPDQQVGLIHFDAHNDVRVMDHGPTNGTPIRGILESGVRVRGSNRGRSDRRETVAIVACGLDEGPRASRSDRGGE